MVDAVDAGEKASIVEWGSLLFRTNRVRTP